jgi:hypothetical protein
MDTVEWGAVDRDDAERSGGRLPRLWDAVPRLGAYALAAVGFALLAAAELAPWARVDLSSTALAGDPAGAATLGITIDRVVSNESFALQVGLVALLGGVGYTLTTSAARRRVALGTTIGLAAGNILLILLLARAALHTFDTLAGLGLGAREAAPALTTGSGVYLAGAGVLVLVAAAVAAVALRRPVRSAAAAVPAVPAGAAPGEPAATVRADEGIFGPDGQRELTVTPMEPLDESYFARPDNH